MAPKVFTVKAVGTAAGNGYYCPACLTVVSGKWLVGFSENGEAGVLVTVSTVGNVLNGEADLTEFNASTASAALAGLPVRAARRLTALITAAWPALTAGNLPAAWCAALTAGGRAVKAGGPSGICYGLPPRLINYACAAS